MCSKKIDKRNKLNQYSVLMCGLASLTIFSTLALLSSTALADTSSTSTASITVSSACTFTSSAANTYSASGINGQTTTITADSITASCNDASGYAVYAIGYSGDTYTGDYHTDMIASTVGNSNNIKTNGTSGASYWKMKLQNLSNATIANSYDNFQTIPASLTKIASYTSNTQAASFTPVYQIYIGTTQPADTYTGKVKYTLVHPNTMVAGTYNVAYNANGGTGTMSSNTNLYNFEEFTLPTNTITAPSGYRFVGWCTVQDQNASGVIPANDPQTTCTGTSFTDGATITASPDTTATSGGTMTLYAYWEVKPIAYWFQDATSDDCGNELHDNRGVDAYKAVAYSTAMINGLCWMTRNLDLPGGTALTDSDTNLTTKSSYTLPNSSTSGYNDIIYNSDGTNFNDTSCGDDNPCYSYYSWNAAIAGDNPSSGNASNDICPKGWRLPTSDELTSLTNSYDSGTKLVGSPFLGVYAGSYDADDEFCCGGSGGYYWSSTADSSYGAHFLGFSSSSASVDDDMKYLGLSVRCVAKS